MQMKKEDKMIRVEVVEKFNFKDFEKIKNSIKRKSIDVKGTLFKGDTFECDEDMVKYLTGSNEQGKNVVKVIEVEPKKEELGFISIEKIEETIGGELTIEEVKPKIVVKPKKKKPSKK